MFRPDIGITAFLNNVDANSWSCVFKHFHSDFVVQEIMDGGKVCEITSEVQVYNPLDEEKTVETISLEPPPKFDQNMQKQLSEFRANSEQKLSVDVVNWTKDERRDLHVYIRSLGGLDSSTKGSEIEIVRLGHARKRRRTFPPEQKFTHFTLAKMDHDTAYAINILTKMLGKNSSSFGFCGTKDRRAITAQRVSVNLTDPEKLYALNNKLRGIKVSNASYEPTALSLGSAWGNRFSVALREFDCKDDESLIKKRIDGWITGGFLNYYGDQRFGSWGNVTAQVGHKILQRDWKGAVELILKPIESYENSMTDALRNYQETKDAKAAMTFVPGGLRFNTNEGKLLKYLGERPTDFKGALMSIPRTSRCLYVHAYQSLVFNKIVSRRAEKYGKDVIPGDLFMVDNKFVESGTVESVVLPLPYFPSRYPENEIRDWYAEILSEDDISKEVFSELRGEFGMGESMRTFIEKPRHVDYRFVWYPNADTVLQHFPPFSETKVDEISGQAIEGFRKALLIQFDLGTGNYATMALRELLRLDIGKDAQKELSIKLRETVVGNGGDSELVTE